MLFFNTQCYYTYLLLFSIFLQIICLPGMYFVCNCKETMQPTCVCVVDCIYVFSKIEVCIINTHVQDNTFSSSWLKCPIHFKGLFTLGVLTKFNAHRMRIGRVHTVLWSMRIHCASSECALSQSTSLCGLDAQRTELRERLSFICSLQH